MTTRTLLPLDVLTAFSKRYPGCWKALEGFRADKGQGLPDWPEWCFVPVAASYAVVSGGGMNQVPPDQIQDVALMHNLTAWRVSQGIYRFDPDIYQEITRTPITGDLPVNLFLQLPEWGVYVELQDHGPAGVFVALEQDQNDGHSEIRLVFVNQDQTTFFLPVHLYQETLETCLARTMEYAAQQAAAAKIGATTLPYVAVPDLAPELLSHTLSLVLYLCSARADVQDDLGNGSERPKPVKTKKGLKLFPPKKPRIFETGYRLGDFIRRQRVQSDPGGGAHASPTPHVRAAHWHTFWTGPRSEPEKRKQVVKWLPPIPVGFKWKDVEEEIMPTVKKVRKN